MTEPGDGLLSTLSANTESPSPAWRESLRKSAQENLRTRGLPTKRDERWRFTSVRDVVDTAFAHPAPGPTPAFDAPSAVDGELRVTCVEGRPIEIGDGFEGVTVRRLADVLRDEPRALEGVLGSIAPSEHFTALNTVLFDDGVVIEVAAGAQLDAPIHVVHAAGTQPSIETAAYPRMVVRVRDGASAKLVESHVGPAGHRYLESAVVELDLGDNARLTHVRIVDAAPTAFRIVEVAARLGRDASYRSHVVTLGGALTRVETRVSFEGAGAECELEGVYHADHEERVDHQLLVHHRAPRCTSHVRYRGLIDGHAKAVFNAIGHVHVGAVGSAAHQENKNLLLSDDATIDTKPHLEIECDEVTASHGSTVGALDERQLFYLRSRGMDERAARDLLTFAFVGELLERIEPESLRERARRAVLGRLPAGATILEVAT
ncbi:MAG: Fe-S cluster assembly protein SufD [Sandaracinaceae bacterium]